MRSLHIPAATHCTLCIIHCTFLSALAQTPQLLTLDAALQRAGQQNAQVQLGTLGVAQQQALRRTAFDAGRLNVNATVGQYNSRRFDNNLTLTQTLPNPALTRRLTDLSARAVSAREAGLAVTQNQVRYDVRAAFYELNYLYQRRRLFRQQDTLLTEFVRAAALRFKTGETGSLEKATAESQQAEQRVRLMQLEADLTATRTRLRTLLNSPDAVDIGEQPLPKLTPTYLIDSLTGSLPQTPQLRQLAEQTRVAEQARRVEEARLKPDFAIGLFSQTLIGPQLIDGQEVYFGAGARFWGGQVGVSFPLLGRAQQARIEAARVGEQVAQTELRTGQFALEQQVQQAQTQVRQYASALTYYEQTGLAQADLIRGNAQRAFGAGDIGYVEFSLALQQSLTIRATYLDLLHQYNQSVLYLGYLLGNP